MRREIQTEVAHDLRVSRGRLPLEPEQGVARELVEHAVLGADRVCRADAARDESDLAERGAGTEYRQPAASRGAALAAANLDLAAPDHVHACAGIACTEQDLARAALERAAV